MHGLKPEMQTNMAGLEDGAHADGEGLAAGIAFVKAGTGGLALQTADANGFFAVRADRAFRPKPGFHVLERFVLIVEVRGGKNRSHDLSPMQANLAQPFGYVK